MISLSKSTKKNPIKILFTCIALITTLIMVIAFLSDDNIYFTPDNKIIAQMRRIEMEKLDRQAHWRYEVGKIEEALAFAGKLLELLEKERGAKDPSLYPFLKNIGEWALSDGRAATAERAYERMLAMRRKIAGAEHPDIVESLIGLATVRRLQGRYADAETLCDTSQKILNANYQLDHPLVAGLIKTKFALDKDLGKAAQPKFRTLVQIINLAEESTASLKRNRPTEALDLSAEIVTIIESPDAPNHPILGSLLHDLGEGFMKQFQYAMAEPLLRWGLTVRENALGPSAPQVGISLMSVATLYFNQGRLADAAPLFKRSLTILTDKPKQEYRSSIVSATLNLAIIHQELRRYEEAVNYYLKARDLAIDNNDMLSSFRIFTKLYSSEMRIELMPGHRMMFANKLEYFTGTLETWEKVIPVEHIYMSELLTETASALSRAGNHAAALPLFERTRDATERMLNPSHPLLAPRLIDVAESYLAMDRNAEAVAAARRAVEIFKSRSNDGSSDRSSGTDAERRRGRDVLVRSIAILEAGSDAPSIDETFQVAQLTSNSSAAAAVAGTAARFAAGGDALSAVVRERQDLALLWRQLDGAILTAASAASNDREVMAEAETRRQFAEVNARLDTLDARIAREFPAYAELSNPKPLELAGAQALLDPDEALLAYVVGEDGIWLWAVRRDRASIHKIELSAAALAGEITTLRGRLDPARNPTMKPFEAERAYELHQKILAPASALLGGARHVFVVPDGALQSLPLGVLVTKPPKDEPLDPKDHREVAWFMRDQAITVLPSVGSLRALRQFSNTTRAGRPFLGVGNPNLEGRPGAMRGVALAELYRGGVANVDAVRRLDPLPETEKELRYVAKSLGAEEVDLLLADRATEPMLKRSQLSTYRVLHFATHGLMTGELRGLVEPALVLTPPATASAEDDGLLTTSKVASLKLNADWVILSACNTAATDGTPDGGGLSGLTKAFFYAGARSVLASHWSVPSNATVALITGSFSALSNDPDIGRAEALQRAQMKMLAPSSPAEFAHPMAWAPFVLVGEGAPGR